jgi:hypothetical protein
MSVPTPRPALKSEISHFCSHRRVARARDTLGNLRQPQPPPVFSARLVGLANGREAAALAEESVERIAALEIDRRDRHVREYRLDGRNVTRRYTMAVSGWPTCLSWIRHSAARRAPMRPDLASPRAQGENRPLAFSWVGSQ